MNKFDKIIFWSEFPQNITNIHLIDFKTEVYVTSKDVKEYNYWKKKLNNKNISFGAWPILSFKEGYWFSKYTSIKDINKLKKFNGINIKIDIEPPIPYKSKLFKKFSLFSLIRDGNSELKKHNLDNSKYLIKTINSLKSKKVIISGFPFPGFLSKTYGDNSNEFDNKFYRNYFLYTTFFKNKILRNIITFYYSLFAKSKIKKYPNDKLYFAIGCVGTGIFTTEPVYENVKEFEKDIDRFLKWGVKNLVVFNLEGLLSKKEPQKWIKVLKDRL